MTASALPKQGWKILLLYTQKSPHTALDGTTQDAVYFGYMMIALPILQLKQNRKALHLKLEKS